MESLRDRVRAFCRSHRLALETDLGQHFLVEEDVLAAITEAAQVRSGETIVEIGPGIGVLTEALLQRGAHVTAIELDARLIPLLQRFVTTNEKRETRNPLTVIHANALSTPMPTVPYAIVANIPYHITSPLLRHVFLEESVLPTSMTLLLQREVAEKICDTHSAGLLTVLVSLFGTPRLVCTVPSEAFLPPPRVESAVLHIACFAHPVAKRTVLDRVFALAKLAFSGKRKMLRNTLGKLPEGTRHLTEAQVDPTRRPETLTRDEWLALARSMEV
jgi:16S rRNA (adenine1518-N6/adenine1519-N6)-dimethyltransferase